MGTDYGVQGVPAATIQQRLRAKTMPDVNEIYVFSDDT